MMKNLIKSNENAGFSLVELIVVIAIMAVMTSVLAPSLLGYVEQSRMQKDDSAMGEVNNAIKLALADQNVYDECLAYNIKNNWSCYVDSNTKAQVAANQVEDKNGKDGVAGKVETDKDYWHYNDSTRLQDEKLYTPNGNMRGMTITFTTQTGGAAAATNEAVFKLADARVNEIVKGTTNKKTNKVDDESPVLEDMTSGGGTTGVLYNKLRAVIGDTVTLSSQTYRNSEYTVFIRMGSMGGNQASAQDAVAVYGQWNGTNLSDANYNVAGAGD